MARLRMGLAIAALSWCCLALLSGAQTTHPTEISALLAVKQQLQDPSKFLANWKRKTDPCKSNWTGVICAPPKDGYYHVQELRCLSMNLTGNFAPELGQLKYVTTLNFMWNSINSSIPKEMGSMTSLQKMLLSGNGISGPLPDELGYLGNLTKFQLDLNNISGTLPISFANLKKAAHFHMNNNSISGQIPPELWNLSSLVHLLLDNNNLSGYLPTELSKMPSLTILQLNNNNFSGSEIPESYGQMPKLLKLTLRNCNLQGPVPDFSGLPRLYYLDLSRNQLNGSLPTTSVSRNITTIDLSHNQLIGSIPGSFSGLPILQKLSLADNRLTGNIPSNLWQNENFSNNSTLVLDFQNNFLTNISGVLNPPSNVTVKLKGNPVCSSGGQQNMSRFCGSVTADGEAPWSFDNSTADSACKPQACPTSVHFEYLPAAPGPCFCALPLVVDLRLRSPSFWGFAPFRDRFAVFITSNLGLNFYQFAIGSFNWTEGPRLQIRVKLFPPYSTTNQLFSDNEVQNLVSLIATFALPSNEFFGPYDLVGFTLYYPYDQVVLNLPNGSRGSGTSVAAIIGIVFGAASFIISVSLIIALVFHLRRKRRSSEAPRGRPSFQLPFRTEGVKEFRFEELETATKGFNSSSEIGYGGYGKVYKGTLGDGVIVAIKRAQQGSLQGQKEFFTEIEFLSRLHHRNLVNLIGYCCEAGEQMLVYEFMPNGSLHSILSARFKGPLSFPMRLQIALDSARGILYLHTEADPPIIHRDVKANNILLDTKFTAKVSDFGISRLAPVADGSGVATPVSTVVKGTPGYLDPEYFLTHKLTEKSDVYSFGIVLLELLTGMQPISHGKNIVREVNGACERGKMWSVIDQRMGNFQEECVRRFMELAIRCSLDATEERPTMLEVVRELENIASVPTTTSSSSSPSTAPYNRKKAAAATSSSSSFNYQPPEELFVGSDLVSGVIPSITPR